MLCLLTWTRLSSLSELMRIDSVKVVPGSQRECTCQYWVHWENDCSVGSDSEVKWGYGCENLRVILSSMSWAKWEFQIKVDHLSTTVAFSYCLFLHWDSIYWMKVISGHVVINTSEVRLAYASTEV